MEALVFGLLLIVGCQLIVLALTFTCQDQIFLELLVVDLNTIQLSAWRTFLGECRRFAASTVFIILILLDQHLLGISIPFKAELHKI